MLIPLERFIKKYLKNLKIKNIYTKQYENCQKIMNWNGSGALKLLIKNNYMIETKYNYVTKEQEFGLVKIGKSQKVIGEKNVEKVVEIKKYKLVDSDEIKDYKKAVIPVFKYVKIGRRKEYTTEYKTVKIPIYKKKRQYYTVKQIQTVKEPIIKNKYIYKRITFKDYIPFLLFEKYRYDTAKGDIEHTIYIRPFYYKYGEAISISAENSLGMREFTTPEEFSLCQQYKDFVNDCKGYMFAGTTQKETLKYFKNFVRRSRKEKRYKSSYSYSEDILSIVFFESADLKGNKKVEKITEDDLKGFI